MKRDIDIAEQNLRSLDVAEHVAKSVFRQADNRRNLYYVADKLHATQRAHHEAMKLFMDAYCRYNNVTSGMADYGCTLTHNEDGEWVLEDNAGNRRVVKL